jgi:hypothetical protein
VQKVQLKEEFMSTVIHSDLTRLSEQLCAGEAISLALSDGRRATCVFTGTESEIHAQHHTHHFLLTITLHDSAQVSWDFMRHHLTHITDFTRDIYYAHSDVAVDGIRSGHDVVYTWRLHTGSFNGFSIILKSLADSICRHIIAPRIT